MKTSIKIQYSKEHHSKKELAHIFGNKNLVKAKLISKKNRPVDKFDVLELTLILKIENIQYNFKPISNTLYLSIKDFEKISEMFKAKSPNITIERED